MADNITVKDANGNDVVIAMTDLASVFINRYIPVNENNNILGVDLATRVLETIDYEHHEIHSGNHYFWADFTTIGNAATWEICMQTPDTTKWTHLVLVISSTLGSQVQIFEGSTITWDGSNEVAGNNNRNSLNTSNWVQFQTDPTVTVDGTALPARSQLGSAINPNQGLPGAGDRNREVILKQNTVYTIRITSLNNSNVVTALLEWYEHTNRTD